MRKVCDIQRGTIVRISPKTVMEIQTIQLMNRMRSSDGQGYDSTCSLIEDIIHKFYEDKGYHTLYDIVKAAARS